MMGELELVGFWVNSARQQNCPCFRIEDLMERFKTHVMRIARASVMGAIDKPKHVSVAEF